MHITTRLCSCRRFLQHSRRRHTKLACIRRQEVSLGIRKFGTCPTALRSRQRPLNASTKFFGYDWGMHEKGGLSRAKVRTKDTPRLSAESSPLRCRLCVSKEKENKIHPGTEMVSPSNSASRVILMELIVTGTSSVEISRLVRSTWPWVLSAPVSDSAMQATI